MRSKLMLSRVAAEPMPTRFKCASQKEGFSIPILKHGCQTWWVALKVEDLWRRGAPILCEVFFNSRQFLEEAQCSFPLLIILNDKNPSDRGFDAIELQQLAACERIEASHVAIETITERFHTLQSPPFLSIEEKACLRS
jgi:hypothetical protein